MKRKEHGYITNRLLYQLSYVGLHSILNWEGDMRKARERVSEVKQNQVHDLKSSSQYGQRRARPERSRRSTVLTPARISEDRFPTP